ncbi:MAG: hypothetical protein QNJ12_14230 [Ilumatobacter sp.]|uniref:hypothetical protein n=1 Tax=Ilumatobacter sp. TaxID=1967498 RepID=UPI00260ED8E6|nr:hypothetical protein [Ilumatobacter sp.]MDJ0769954.1 hypothetical protein [Ilumatobacter sp.]
MTEILGDATREDGVRLVAGTASSDRMDDLVLAALAEIDGETVPVLLHRSPTSYGARGCRTEIADRVVPGGESIVAACRSGGTNGLGYVAVLGVDPRGSTPRVLIEVSCSVTDFVIDGSTLRLVSEGEKPGTNFAGAEQPDQELTWSAAGLTPNDRASFNTYCATGDDRYHGPAG